MKVRVKCGVCQKVSVFAFHRTFAGNLFLVCDYCGAYYTPQALAECKRYYNAQVRARKEGICTSQ